MVLNDTAHNSAKKTNKQTNKQTHTHTHTHTHTPNTDVMLQIQPTDVNNHQTEWPYSTGVKTETQLTLLINSLQ